jgi:hypothetical protein
MLAAGILSDLTMRLAEIHWYDQGENMIFLQFQWHGRLGHALQGNHRKISHCRVHKRFE